MDEDNGEPSTSSANSAKAPATSQSTETDTSSNENQNMQSNESSSTPHSTAPVASCSRQDTSPPLQVGDTTPTKESGESSTAAGAVASSKTALKTKLSKRNYRSRSPITTDPLLSTPWYSSTSSSSSSSSSPSDDSSTDTGPPETTVQTTTKTKSNLRSRRKRNRPHLDLGGDDDDQPNDQLIASLSAGLFHPSDDSMPLQDTDTDNDSDDDINHDHDDDDVADSDSDSSLSSMEEVGGGGNGTTGDTDKINLDFLCNAKAQYRFCTPRDFLYRQSGLAFNRTTRRTINARDPGHFQRHASGCRYAVEKLELMYKLRGHEGCVNSLNFNEAGTLLASGSDDLKIMLWKWASNEMVYQFESTHITNVFQSKFMNLGGGQQAIHIISSARDGNVIHHELPSSGGQPVSTSLIKHTLPVHKIALPETSPFEVLTAGEDGYVIRCDLRDNVNERLVTAKVNNRRMALYSIAAHPLKGEFCVSGRDQFVRVYDRRSLKNVMKTYCPPHLLNVGQARHISNITCAVYNYVGDEILASYSDDDIYLFDTNNSTPGSYLHKYQGHQNTCTIKGVNFFGPRSEFVMSGSDCGNCFFWDKQNESIVQWMAADEKGAVNVLEPHPSFPFVATSGIDDDIKIWVSSSEKPSAMEGLKKCVQNNCESRLESGDMMGNEILSFFMRQCMRRSGGNQERDATSNQQRVVDLISSSDSDEEEEIEGSTSEKLRALPCAPS